MHNNYITQTGSGRILIRRHDEENARWLWCYCGRTADSFQVKPNSVPGQNVEVYRIKQFRGRKIIQQARVHNGMVRNLPEKTSTRILRAIEQLSSGQQLGLNMIFIENGRRVFCRLNNSEIEICTLDDPITFEEDC